MTTLATSEATLFIQKGGEYWEINYLPQCCPIITYNISLLHDECILHVSTSLVVSNVEAASLGSCWWLRAIFAWQVALDTSVQRSDNIKHSYRKLFEYCYVSYVKHVKLVVISSCLTGRSVEFHCSGLGGAALIADWEIKMLPKTNAETPPPCRGTDGAGQNTGARGVMERPVGPGTVGA